MNQPQQQTPQPAAETQETDAERLMKGPVSVKFGKAGVQIEDLDQMYRYAVSVHRSKLQPKGLGTPEAIMLAIQMGAELGMKPMTAIQNICVINGRPSIWGDAALAVCRMSKLFDEKEFTEEIGNYEGGEPAFGVCAARRVGGVTITRTFSMEDAKRAGLLGKDNWKNYPRRMLQMRARSWALRDCFSDVLLGMRLAEEQQDCGPEQPTDHTQSHIEQARKMGAKTFHENPAIRCKQCGAGVRDGEPLCTTCAGRPVPPSNPPTQVTPSTILCTPAQKAVADEVIADTIANPPAKPPRAFSGPAVYDDPPANPPTAEEVEVHSMPPEEQLAGYGEQLRGPAPPTPEQVEQQAAAMAELSQRIEAANYPNLLDTIERHIVQCVERKMIDPAQVVALTAKLAEARERVENAK